MAVDEETHPCFARMGHPARRSRKHADIHLEEWRLVVRGGFGNWREDAGREARRYKCRGAWLPGALV